MSADSKLALVHSLDNKQQILKKDTDSIRHWTLNDLIYLGIIAIVSILLRVIFINNPSQVVYSSH
jgi:hypothetical protein